MNWIELCINESLPADWLPLDQPGLHITLLSIPSPLQRPQEVPGRLTHT